jgi:CDP-glucose 4,6-dehydratase
MNLEFWQRKKVLITGGVGFIGRWVGRALLPAECELHIVDVQPMRATDIPHRFHQADLRKLDACCDLLKQIGPDVVIHLAGQPGVGSSHDNPVGAFEANVLVTFNMLEACRKTDGVRSLVAVSSNHVYGDQHHLPTPEDAALTGRGTYAATKLAADALSQCYGKTYGVPVGVARMTNSYGGDDHHAAHIITASIHSALRGERPVIKQSGRDRKGYLFVQDTAEGLLAVAEGTALRRELAGEAFNIVPNESHTVLELVRAVQHAVGTNFDPIIERPDAPFENEQLDNAKARSLLGWSPRHALADGLREAVAWYREHTTTNR